MYVHMCAHKETDCKGTKYFWDVQIYERKSAEFLNFVSEMGGFGEYRTKKEEKKSAATAVYNWIENKNINDTIIAVLIFYVTQKIIKKNNIK